MDKPLLNREIAPLIAAGLRRTSTALVHHYRRLSIAYLALLLVALVVYLAMMPVGSGDTDLWYHMNGGRLLAEYGTFPDHAFFSYIEPKPEWINYFWGFQLLSYEIHHWLGYEGLIALRVALTVAAFFGLIGILVRPEDTPWQRALALSTLVLVLILLVGRTEQIRPHIVSYTMIATFIYILGYRRNWLPALPVLTLLWINLHGTEWPVGAAICGSYLIQSSWSLYHGDTDPLHRKVIFWTTACLPAALINPYFFDIALAPFSFPSDIYAYIAELQPYSLENLLTIEFQGMTLPLHSMIGLLFVATITSWLLLLWRRRLNLPVAVLSVVGLYLLSRGNRFVWEWMLLSLPLWRTAIDQLGNLPNRSDGRPAPIQTILLSVILISPFTTWSRILDSHANWPVDTANLPVGISNFLKAQRAYGNLFAPPNSGGYLAWRLYPDILITADMQTPPSTNWHHFMAFASLRNSDALARVLDEYEHGFLAIPIDSKATAEILKKHERYVPVHFDDQFVLYADKTQWPALVSQFAFVAVNPFNLADGDEDTADKRLHELRRVLDLQPGGRRIQHGITKLLFDERRYEEALPVAEKFAESMPGDANSHYLLGNILLQLERCEEAVAHYELALVVASEEFESEIHQKIGECAFNQKDFRSAYRAFDRGMNPYLGEEDVRYLYQFALSAVAIGKIEKARSLLRQLLLSVSDVDRDVAEQAEKLLADI